MIYQIPDEVKCFICTKALDVYDQYQFATLITTKDAQILAAFIVCLEDLNWIKDNRDAATALVQSRLDNWMKKSKENERLDD